MLKGSFTVRAAGPGDDAEIARLVVEGFADKFRPIFGRGMGRSVPIMERWVHLEHALGGVHSLVIQNNSTGRLAASVGVRTSPSEDDALSRGLWDTLRRNLGFLRASWAATLLSYPRYSASRSEAYVERLVVTAAHRRSGMARALLEEAEGLALKKNKLTVGLHVSEGNDPAIRLYEASGYAEKGRQRSFLTGRFLGIRDWIYLQKTL